MIGAAVQLLSSNTSRDRLIAVEDTQWADSMTMEFLDKMSVHVTKLPILLLQTSRSTVSCPGWDSLPLSGLGTQSMSDLVASHWGGTPPPGLSTFVEQQCDGIPLYAEEMTLFLKTHQPSTDAPLQLEEAAERKRRLDPQRSPVGQARRCRSGSSHRSTRQRHRTRVQRCLARRLLDVMDPKALDADLIRLASSGVIERKDAHGEIYRFRHALLHEAAYGSLLRSDCRRLHQRIAQLLIAEDEPSLPAGVAAWQCAQAGLKLEAARFALKAAEAYVLHSALREADQLLELAAEQIKTLPGQPVRTGLLLDLLELQGTVSAHLEGEGSQKARKTYARAMSLMRRQTVPDLGGRFPLYWGWWFTAPNILTQQSRAHVLVEDMEGVSDPETRLQSYHCAWATGFHAAQHDFCLDCVMQGLALYDRERAVAIAPFMAATTPESAGSVRARSPIFSSDSPTPASGRSVNALIGRMQPTTSEARCTRSTMR